MKKPLILVTNDDGITAPGIRALVESASLFGEVVVVAPDSPQSGQGHAITISKPIRLHPNDVFGEIEAYECSGTPVDCVKLAKGVILKDRKIDLCVSGVNHGSNAATNILYSGTMSAAMEASIVDIPAIGFSLLDYTYEADFESSKPFVQALIQNVLAMGINGAYLLNVNIPAKKTNEIKGIKICRQANSGWEESFMEATDPRGQKYYWLTGEFVDKDKGTDTDIWALQNDYISVVPSMHDLTAYKALTNNVALEEAINKTNHGVQ